MTAGGISAGQRTAQRQGRAGQSAEKGHAWVGRNSASAKGNKIITSWLLSTDVETRGQ